MAFKRYNSTTQQWESVAVGPPGFTGSVGTKGDLGYTGSQGIIGFTGSAGSIDTSTANRITTSNTTASTSTTTGALIVAGGAGIAGNINAGAIYTNSIFYSNGSPYISGGGGGGGGGGGASISVSETAPTSPQNGALWFDTSSSKFYVYYSDPTSSQWVGLNPAFSPLKIPASTVSDTVPVNPMSGDLWFNSSDGKFYVYYTDGDSSQWVSLNPVLNLAASGLSIDLLSDVDTSTITPSNGQVLTWDSTNSLWKPAAVANPFPNTIFVGDSNITISDTGSNGTVTFTLDGTAVSTLTSTYMRIPIGPTGDRPASPQVGMLRYNTTVGTLEQYNTNGWESIGGNPTITNIAPSSFNGSINTAITVSGSNFQSGAYIKFIGNTGIIYSAPTTSVISNSLIQCTTPALPALYKPYSVQVVNPNGASSTLPAALDSGNGPNWVTAVTLPTIFDSRITGVSIQLQATDPEGQTITYQATTALPNGLVLDQNTGVLSGTLSSVAVDTTWSFTVAATDSVSNSNSRTFNLLQKAPVITSFTTVGSTSWVAPAGINSIQVLVVAGGGGGGNGSASGGGGGGAGGGLIYDAAFTVVGGTTYTVSVGQGGTANIAGGNSQFGTYIANGGGQGGQVGTAGGNGGSGGGGGGSTTTFFSGGFTNTAFGTNGGANAVGANGTAGGGGGAGSSGAGASTSLAGAGGSGRSINITGSAVFYGGGGGGGSLAGGTVGAAGIGGGVAGSNSATIPTAAAVNTGGGGGGGGTSTGGAGGSGIVIVRY